MTLAIRRSDVYFLFNIQIPLVLNNTKHFERNIVVDMISNCDGNTVDLIILRTVEALNLD